MSSSEFARKADTQGSPPLQRQPTGVPDSEPTAPTSSRSKKAMARRKLRKERSMRIPAIENDLMNRIGITKNSKAVVRAASRKATRSRARSPYKSLLVEIARKKDGSQSTIGSIAEGSISRISIDLVRCASPEPAASTSHSTCPHPLAPNQPTTRTSGAEAKGKQIRDTPQSTIVLRPLPSRLAASSSRSAGSPLSRTPIESPETHLSASGSSSPKKSFLPRKRSPLACSDDSSPTEQTAPVVDAQPTNVQREVVSTVLDSASVNSSDESDSQSDSSSDATSSVLDDPVAGVAQAAAVKKSLLSQIEERNEGKKWDDLMGFFHSLAPSEVCGVLKTATRAGRSALRKLARKEVTEPETSNRKDEAHGLGRTLRPRSRDESVLPFDDSGSDREGEVMNQTTVPPRQRQFLYKAKGKARAKSPSPSPVFASQTGACVSSSCAPASRKRSRTPESESDDEDDAITEPPTKRHKEGKRNRPLKREGAFYIYPTPAEPPVHDHENDSDDAEPMHVNLVKSFLDQIQDLDDDVPATSWPLPRSSSSKCDSFAARDNDDDEWAENRVWTLRANSQFAAGRQLRRRRTRVEFDDAMRRPVARRHDRPPPVA